MRPRFEALRRQARLAWHHVRDDAGQGLAEYGLILGLVAVVCATALSTLAGGITGLSAWTLP